MNNSQNIDFLQSATIVTNPTNLKRDKGLWTQILCLTDCVGVTVIDRNLTTDSELWTDSEFARTAIIVGKFEEVTLTGKVVLYA